MKVRLKTLYKSFIDILKLPEMRILPGQLAFNFLMSFIPIMALCLIICGYIMSNYNFYAEFAFLMPNAIEEIIEPLLNVDISGVSTFFLIICYVLIASNGLSSIIITSNELYKIKNQNYLHLKLKSFIMTIVLILLLMFLLFIPVFGDVIFQFIYKLISNSLYIDQFMIVFKVLKIVTSFIFIYFCIKILYVLAPNAKIKSRTTTIGAVFTTLGWILCTEVFAFYITKIAKFDLLYGNFANILILLFWLYILAYLFVVGMALNISKYGSIKEKEIKTEVKK